MPFLSSTSQRWMRLSSGSGPSPGRWWTWAGMEFGRFYSNLWAKGCIMLAVGSPKAQAGGRASPQAGGQEEQLRASLAEIRHRVPISNQPNHERRL